MTGPAGEEGQMENKGLRGFNGTNGVNGTNGATGPQGPPGNSNPIGVYVAFPVNFDIFSTSSDDNGLVFGNLVTVSDILVEVHQTNKLFPLLIMSMLYGKKSVKYSLGLVTTEVKVLVGR